MWYSTASKNKEMFIAFPLPKELSKRLKHIDDLDDDLHMTLFYVEDIEAEDRDEVLKSVEITCAEQKPLSCKFVEIGMMGNGSNTLVANVEALGLTQFYVNLLSGLQAWLGRDIDRKYDLIPHVTLRYDNPESSVSMDDLRKVSWTADELMVQFGRGNKRYLFPLKG